MLAAYRFPALLLLLVLLQAGFWHKTHHRLPDMTVVPTPPGKPVLDVFSFGDGEFLFRSMAFLMGNAGDTFGRVTPLYKYDMKTVHTWFSLLDNYNHDSDLLPSLAAYYYSQTQRRKEARHMVDYLIEHATINISKKWWWLTQATYIALHRVEDTELALKAAAPLANAPGVPVAMQQLPAIVHEQRGEFGDALYIIESILHSGQTIPEDDLRYMNYFVEERIQKLDELDKNSAKQLKSISPQPK